MDSVAKTKKLAAFKDEKEFREFLIDFLKKSGFTCVTHTHRYGTPEQGKDIIAKFPHEMEGEDWLIKVEVSGSTKVRGRVNCL